MGRNNKAAIYVRVSTEKESQKYSPEHQEATCREYCEKTGLEPIRVYEDRDSGTSLYGREDMQNLLRDAESGVFSHLIFVSLSRFSRNLTDSLVMKDELTLDHNIRIVSIEEGYDSDIDKDNTKFGMYQVMNSNYSYYLSKSSRRGLLQSGKKGNFTGSVAPYGYKKALVNDVKTLVIEPYDAEIVKLIYELYTKNEMGDKRIVEFLNKEGYKSPKNELWGISSVQRILTNKAYVGENIFSKYSLELVKRQDGKQHRRKSLKLKNEEEWESSGIRWEPIISEETFLLAKKLRQNRGGGKRGGVRNVGVNPLAGILKCAHCKMSMVAIKAGGKKRDFRYLICSSRRRKGISGCDNSTWFPLNEFIDELKLYLKEEITTFISTIDIDKNMKQTVKKSGKTIAKRIKELDTKIADSRDFLTRQGKLNAKGILNDEQYENDLISTEQEIKELKKKREMLIIEANTEHDESVYKQKVADALTKLANLELDTVTFRNLLLEITPVLEVHPDGPVDIIDSPLSNI